MEIFRYSVKDIGWICFFFLVQSANFAEFVRRSISLCEHVCVILLYLLVFSRFELVEKVCVSMFKFMVIRFYRKLITNALS